MDERRCRSLSIHRGRSPEVVNRSLSKAFLRRYHFEPILSLIPMSIPPTSITLFGLCACLLIPALFQVGMAPAEKIYSLTCCMLIYIYMVSDHLDGMHAERTRSGTAFGAMLDHLCDFIDGSLIALGAFWSVGFSLSTFILITMFYILAFSISHLEVVVRGELWLGRLGPLEGLVVVIAFLASWGTGAGRAIWGARLPGLGGIPAYWILIGAFLVGFSSTIGHAAARLRWQIDQRYVGFVGIVIFFGICQILCAPADSMALWAVMVGYAGRYVLELLTAAPGEVPTPSILAPAIAALITFSFSLGHLPMELYKWSLNGLAAALFVSLVLST